MKILLVMCISTLFLNWNKVMAQPLIENANAGEIKTIIESFAGDKVVIVNFWATWCAPCVEEFPDFMRLKQKHNSEVEVLFVSADFEEDRNRAIEFLDHQGVYFKSYFKVGNDQDFISTISEKWTGALPFTMIFDKEGNLVKEWEEQTSFSKLEKELHKILERE